MFEVIRWVSLVLLWVLNIAVMIRGIRLNKRLKATEEMLDVEREYCLTMIAACNEFLEAAHGEESDEEN